MLSGWRTRGDRWRNFDVHPLFVVFFPFLFAVTFYSLVRRRASHHRGTVVLYFLFVRGHFLWEKRYFIVFQKHSHRKSSVNFMNLFYGMRIAMTNKEEPICWCIMQESFWSFASVTKPIWLRCMENLKKKKISVNLNMLPFHIEPCPSLP